MTESRPPFPDRVSLGYTPNSQWRNRDVHVVGRADIVAFLTQKWDRELDYVLRKNLWDFHDNRIALRSSTSAATPVVSGTAAMATNYGSSPRRVCPPQAGGPPAC